MLLVGLSVVPTTWPRSFSAAALEPRPPGGMISCTVPPCHRTAEPDEVPDIWPALLMPVAHAYTRPGSRSGSAVTPPPLQSTALDVYCPLDRPTTCPASFTAAASLVWSPGSVPRSITAPFCQTAACVIPGEIEILPTIWPRLLIALALLP